MAQLNAVGFSGHQTKYLISTNLRIKYDPLTKGYALWSLADGKNYFLNLDETGKPISMGFSKKTLSPYSWGDSYLWRIVFHSTDLEYVYGKKGNTMYEFLDNHVPEKEQNNTIYHYIPNFDGSAWLTVDNAKSKKLELMMFEP